MEFKARFYYIRVLGRTFFLLDVKDLVRFSHDEARRFMRTNGIASAPVRAECFEDSGAYTIPTSLTFHENAPFNGI